MDIENKIGYVKESGSMVEWPILEKTIIRELNLTSSLEVVGDSYLASHSYFPLIELLPASHSEEETFDKTDIEKSGSQYYFNYILRDKTVDELVLHYKHCWQDVRTKRNRLLQETDYMGNADYPITDEWRIYRQSLRDITEQGNPFDVIWPNKPE